MTVGSVGGGFRAGLLERLFTKADSDKSQTVGADELAGLLSGEDASTKASAILASRDLDGDNQLTLAELTGGTLAPETFASLLSAQEYVDADGGARQADNRKALDDFFDRADLDGDGKLSRDEFDAERTLRMAQSLDTDDAVPQHLFAVMPQALDDDVISRDELMLGRRLVDMAKAVSLDDLALDPKLVERLKALHPQGGSETPPPSLDPVAAMGDAVREADLTHTLIARLIQQLERTIAAPPTQDLLA